MQQCLNHIQPWTKHFKYLRREKRPPSVVCSSIQLPLNSKRAEGQTRLGKRGGYIDGNKVVNIYQPYLGPFPLPPATTRARYKAITTTTVQPEWALIRSLDIKVRFAVGKSYLPRRIQQLRVEDTDGIFLVLKYFCTERKTVRKGKNHLHYKLDKPNQSEKVSSRERKKKPPPLPPTSRMAFFCVWIRPVVLERPTE